MTLTAGGVASGRTGAEAAQSPAQGAEPVETALRAPDTGYALAPVSAEAEGGGCVVALNQNLQPDVDPRKVDWVNRSALAQPAS